jgi:hypothetical protein
LKEELFEKVQERTEVSLIVHLGCASDYRPWPAMYLEEKDNTPLIK